MASRVITSSSPQHPRDVVVSLKEASRDDVAAAAATARGAQHEWAAVGPSVRANALDAAAAAVENAAEELVALVVREVGKPRSEASGEVARTVAILRYYAQQVFEPSGATFHPSAGKGMTFTKRRPLGVVSLVTPWNFPLAIPLWKAAPALAFGNSVLLKPAPQATACALRLAELLLPHLPEGLFMVLPGGGATGRAVIDEADVVSFTGSAAVGTQVAASAVGRGVPVQCEMGGLNPVIVFESADVATVAAEVAVAAFAFAGQKCTAPQRIVVVGDPRAFTDAFVAATRALEVGDPAEPGVLVGPVIDEAARDRVIDTAALTSGRVITGGRSSASDGWFVEPTIVTDVNLGDRLLQEEVFGPVCAIVAAGSGREAVRVANDGRYGLAAGVYCEGLDEALGVVDQLAAGQIRVNVPTTGVDFYLPFGGERGSSFGPREQGKAAQEFYTSLHTTIVGPGARH